MTNRQPDGRAGRRERDRTSIDDILALIPDRPVATTRGRGWGGVTLDLHQHASGYSVCTPAHDHHLICYCSAGGGRLIQGRDGILHDSFLSAGMSLVMPAGCDSTWEGDAAPSARFRVPVEIVQSAAEQLGRRAAGAFEIRNVFETRDNTIERGAQILTSEIDRPAHRSQSLIVETLSCALAAHMLRSYNAFELPADEDIPPLAKHELAKVLEFIEGNLDRSISLVELASLVNVSRFHFARLFKRSTGTTAIAFVEQCRIRRAQALVADTDTPLAEIALMTGFADQSHFTRRFHRAVGCTPAAFARERGRRRPGRRPASCHGDS